MAEEGRDLTSELGPGPGLFGTSGGPVDLSVLEPGTHLISFYQDDAELARSAAVFVSAGLAAGDRVLYVAGDRPLPAALTALEANPAAGLAVTTGQLVVRSFSDVYDGTSQLDMTSAASRFRATAHRARTEGFPGLRVALEAGEFTRALGSIERVMAWERMATHIQHELGVSSVCQYDQRQLCGERSGFLAAEHAGTAPESALVPQASFLATPAGLRITGEVDTTNRGRFLRVICARLRATRQLKVDVEELAFMDAGTLGELHRIACSQPPDARITLTGVSAQLQRVIEIAGWRSPQLTIEPAVS
jgi:anti-anti-sigma regulatory factor